jgi:hypothetical protein
MAVGDVTKGLKAGSEAAARTVVEKVAASISADDVREPKTPTKRLEAEARRIAGRLKKDDAALRKRSAYKKDDGFILLAATALFGEAARRLFETTSPNLPSKVTKERQAAEALLTSVWVDLQYVAEEFDDDDLLDKLGTLREGHSLDDTVNDLELTAPLVRTYAKQLAAVGTPGGAQTAKKLDAYHRALAAEQGEHDVDDSYDALKQRRDRLGLVLEAHLARIRRHGKQAFADDPGKAGQYIDTYRSETRSNKVPQAA